MHNTNQNQAVAALLTLLVLLSSTAHPAEVPLERASKTFYADARHGDDTNPGTLAAPFKTLGKALAVVDGRVKAGIFSDKIYLRAGVYRNDAVPDDPKARTFTCYYLNLKGRRGNHSLISAMPAKPGAHGAVQMKSGNWYEPVTIDDGYIIDPALWEPHDENIWKADPGYVNHAYGKPGPPYRGLGYRTGANSHAVANGPRMVLQDDEALSWVDPWPNYDPLKDPYDSTPVVDPTAVLTEPGMRTYDQLSHTLYVWPFGGKNPATCKMESWKGKRDSRFRHLFDGDMEYTELRGLTFRLARHFFRDIWMQQAGKEVPLMDHVTWEDNVFSYCTRNLFQDAYRHEAIAKSPRTQWLIRNNVFYRTTLEVFQTWGEGHVFENNAVIERAGSLAGGKARVGTLNLRHVKNITVRNNYIHLIGNDWAGTSLIMLEVDENQRDSNGEAIFGRGMTIENNYFRLTYKGHGIHLGRGGGRMHDIAIKNNIFDFNGKTEGTWGGAIHLCNPYKNLEIHNNVFFDFGECEAVINAFDDRSDTRLEDMANTISIRRNVFMNAKGGCAISERITRLEGINIEENHFFNAGDATGKHATEGAPLFTDPAKFNFTLQPDSPAIREGNDLGAYEFGKPVSAQSQWWNAKSHGSVSRLNKEPSNPRRKEIP